MKLKFNFEAVYNGEVFATAGEIKEVSEANGFASRWIRRGAEIVVEEPMVEKKIVPAKEKLNSDIAKPAKAEQNKKENTKSSAKESIKEEVL